MSTESEGKHRPPVEERWGTQVRRTEPVQIDIRTRWLYSADSAVRLADACACCPGRHAFSRSGDVVRSDVPARYSSEDDLAGHLHRAIRQFGDDADLVIEVRPR